ncbi:Uncharacterized protein QTN25_005624 [Entamoeba marina]
MSTDELYEEDCGLDDFENVTSPEFNANNYDLEELVDMHISAYEFHVSDSIRRFQEGTKALKILQDRLVELKTENEGLKKQLEQP